jgi:hypothetical protein
MRIVLLSLLACAACKPIPEWAKTPARGSIGEATIAGQPLPIPKLPSAPVVDGKLDDAAWSQAAVIGPLVDPGDGSEPARGYPVQGFARLGWTDEGLWLGAVIRDAHPTSPFTREQNDPHVWGEASGIELMLQPGDPGDNRDYYELQVDVRGAVFDSHFDDYGRPTLMIGHERIFGHQDWSSHAVRASYVDEGRFWSVEVELPWSSLQPARVAIPPQPGDVWRLNVYSFRDGQRYSLAWSPLRRQGNFHKASRFGRVKWE